MLPLFERNTSVTELEEPHRPLRMLCHVVLCACNSAVDGLVSKQVSKQLKMLSLFKAVQTGLCCPGIRIIQHMIKLNILWI